jgi:hypothetical protein
MHKTRCRSAGNIFVNAVFIRNLRGTVRVHLISGLPTNDMFGKVSARQNPQDKVLGICNPTRTRWDLEVTEIYSGWELVVAEVRPSVLVSMGVVNIPEDYETCLL